MTEEQKEQRKVPYKPAVRELIVSNAKMRGIKFEVHGDDTDQTLLDRLIDILKTPPEKQSSQEEADSPGGMEIVAKLLYDVDIHAIEMPEARRKLGEWWNQQNRTPEFSSKLRDRVRRLKQIMDGMYEETWTLLGSQR